VFSSQVSTWCRLSFCVKTRRMIVATRNEQSGVGYEPEPSCKEVGFEVLTAVAMKFL
jgi:hypothetical protein